MREGYIPKYLTNSTTGGMRYAYIKIRRYYNSIMPTRAIKNNNCYLLHIA